MSKSILDDIFKAPEEDVGTFMDILKSEGIAQNKSSEFDQMVVSGNLNKKINAPGNQTTQPKLTIQVSAWIKIEHGWAQDPDDYVWHLSAHHPKKPFRVSAERVCYAIAKIMNDVIPQSTQVDIFLPMADWDIQEFTFKAIGLKTEWSINQKAIDEMTLKLFEILNTLV